MASHNLGPVTCNTLKDRSLTSLGTLPVLVHRHALLWFGVWVLLTTYILGAKSAASPKPHRYSLHLQEISVSHFVDGITESGT